ncbi:MAG: DUF2569 domain-containing protein [Planctomycetota bacterium]
MTQLQSTSEPKHDLDPPSAPPEARPKEPEKVPYPAIGGWLILVGFGLVMITLRVTLYIFDELLPIFSGGAWDQLTTPGMDSYHHLWAPLILIELCGNLITVMAGVGLLYFFIQRRQFFPELMIGFLAFRLSFAAVDFVVARKIFGAIGEESSEPLMDLLRAGIMAAVWIPYFLVSKRVKGTFVS